MGQLFGGGGALIVDGAVPAGRCETAEVHGRDMQHNDAQPSKGTLAASSLAGCYTKGCSASAKATYSIQQVLPGLPHADSAYTHHVAASSQKVGDAPGAHSTPVPCVHMHQVNAHVPHLSSMVSCIIDRASSLSLSLDNASRLLGSSYS